MDSLKQIFCSKIAHIIAAFRDWRVSVVIFSSSHGPDSAFKIYVGGVIYFGLNCALASIGAFLPTLITTFGYSESYLSWVLVTKNRCSFFSPVGPARAQLMTVPPYIIAALVMVSFSLSSDKCQNRGKFIALASFIGAFGYLSVSPSLSHLP